MKHNILLAATIILCALHSKLQATEQLTTDSIAQDTVIIKLEEPLTNQKKKTSTNKEDRTCIRIGNKILFVSSNTGDTLSIRLGKEEVTVPSNTSTTKESEQKKEPQFKGHWENIQLGRVLLANSDYSIYDNPYDEFMELDESKSVEFNLNWAITDFALNSKKTIGCVTGVGLSWSNLQFSNRITLAKSEGKIVPIPLADGKTVKKSKLTALYLDIPLLIEFQSKHSKSSRPVYLSLGGVGSVKLGSHTKIKYSGDREKDRGDFYLNPFRYGALAVIGYRGIHIYGKYFFNDYFQSNKGPGMNQYAIGIGISDW